MRKVLILTGLLLILMGCSLNNNDKDEQYAGEINGQLIERPIYTTSFLYNYKDLTNGNNNYKATDKEIDRLEEQTWQGITRSVIINQFITENNLEVTQEEVNDSLLNNPPKAVTESGYFSAKGKFDLDKYRSSILTNEPVNTDIIKYNSYQSITMQKIQQQLVKNADISRSDVEKYYQLNYATADVILLSMDLNSTQPTVTNKEVELRWENDKSKYYYDPSLSIKYIIQDIKPTKKEIADTKSTIDSLYFVLSQGSDFDSAVREFSSNLKSYPLGKMPFLKLENVPEIIRNLVATAQIGEVITPVSKNNVWYIYKVLEKTKTMVKLQELKHPVQITQKTILQRREEFRQIDGLIKQIGIENAAEEYGWKIYSADNLNRQRVFVEELGDLTDLINDAYNKPDGYIYAPIYNKGERFLVMIQIVQNRLNKKKDLDSLFLDIQNEILLQKQFDYVSKRLRSLADNYKNINPEELTDVTYTVIEKVTKDSKLTNEENTEFNLDILSLSSKGDYTKCIREGSTGYIAILLEKNKADKTYFKNNYYLIQGEYRNDDLRNYFNTWLKDEIKNAKVKKWFSMKDFYKGTN